MGRLWKGFEGTVIPEAKNTSPVLDVWSDADTPRLIEVTRGSLKNAMDAREPSFREIPAQSGQPVPKQ